MPLSNVALGDVQHSANDLIARQPPGNMVARTIAMQKGEHDALHCHPWHQLIFPRSGALRTRAQNSQHYLASNRAIFIPANVPHESWAIVESEFVGIYMSPQLSRGFRSICGIIEVSPLLRELINEITRLPLLVPSLPDDDKRIIQVFADQVVKQKELALSILMPGDNRVFPIAQQVIEDPGSRKTLDEWSESVGASTRTINRLFKKDTGQSFGQWVNTVRLLSTVTELEKKLPVQHVAINAGYSSTSAYVYAFRKLFGTTPTRFVVNHD